MSAEYPIVGYERDFYGNTKPIVDYSGDPLVPVPLDDKLSDG